MKQEPIFNWDPEEGVASCIIKYKNHIWTFKEQGHQPAIIPLPHFLYLRPRHLSLCKPTATLSFRV